jgi:class I fructose-bisphosphate aldolase
MAVAELSTDRLSELLGDDADDLLGFSSPAVPKDLLHLPGPDFIDRVVTPTDRNPQVLRNLHQLYASGRLANTGYVSILPIDQGIEHSAAASFAPNPIYFDPENLVKLALEGGCNAIASTVGVLGSVSRSYAHKLPFIVKLNHNELMTYPNEYDQVAFASVRRAWELGAAGVGATIYFGSEQSRRQIVEIAQAFEEAHELGMFTVLWCYLRNNAFQVDGVDYHTAADLTGQANHLGVTIEADIIKQKLATNNGGYVALNQNGSSYGKTSKLVYEKLTTDHPIDLCRWQVINCYSGRAPLINSGGASAGDSDLADAVKTAVINKRAGGTGLISGRKAFQRPMDDGVALLHAIQDVYLNESVTIA